MGRRDVGSEDTDVLPAIDVEYSASGERRSLQRSARSATVVVVEPPFADLVRRVGEQVRRAHQRYGVVIGNHRESDPRVRSLVEHRIARPAAQVARILSLTQYDEVNREYRRPARLHLAWSWPELPMWLSVAELSSTQCALRLSLRSRHRLRYPARYFHEAHSVLDRLAAGLAG